MSGEERETAQPKNAPEIESIPATVDAEQIFRGAREVWIDLEGVRYRLRITRRNRLILQK